MWTSFVSKIPFQLKAYRNSHVLPLPTAIGRLVSSTLDTKHATILLAGRQHSHCRSLIHRFAKRTVPLCITTCHRLVCTKTGLGTGPKRQNTLTVIGGDPVGTTSQAHTHARARTHTHDYKHICLFSIYTMHGCSSMFYTHSSLIFSLSFNFVSCTVSTVKSVRRPANTLFIFEASYIRNVCTYNIIYADYMQIICRLSF